MKKLSSAAVMVSALLCAVSDAKAYCGFPEITTWYDNPAPVSIPVYIVNAGPTSVGLSGLSTSAYAHAVLQRWRRSTRRRRSSRASASPVT